MLHSSSATEIDSGAASIHTGWTYIYYVVHTWNNWDKHLMESSDTIKIITAFSTDHFQETVVRAKDVLIASVECFCNTEIFISIWPILQSKERKQLLVDLDSQNNHTVFINTFKFCHCSVKYAIV